MQAPSAFTIPIPLAEHFVEVGSVRLRCEEHGAGPALVLLGGLGASASLWFRQIGVLAAQYRVLAIDNRGAGGSSKPAGPYSIDSMADDVVGVLDALGVERAHVLGASMGGLIAQAFALRHPGRLRRLVLACTTPGGAAAVLPAPDVLEAFADRHPSPDVHLRRVYALSAAPEWVQENGALVDAFVAHRRRAPAPAHAHAAQAQAAAAWDAGDRLAGIAAPTLVLHGAGDRVVPAANAVRLAAAIPGARLELMPGTEHVFFIEQADVFNAHVLRFLAGDACQGG